MVDKPEIKKRSMVVEAESTEEAAKKYENFWENMTDEYCVYYSAVANEVSEVIR